MRKSSNYGEVNVVENEQFQYGVIDNNGIVVVPFGKYGWISGYDHGLARVKSIHGEGRLSIGSNLMEKPKWGIIDKKGEVVLPVEYDEIWNFLGKGRTTTKVIKEGVSSWFSLETRKLFSHDPSLRSFHLEHEPYDEDHWDDYGRSYGKYSGSYAQDVMGYSDDVIDDAFEGDPDAYWNID